LSIFINLSNHRTEKWSKTQLEEAQKYGEVRDMAFPNIDPNFTEEEINNLVNEYYTEIIKYNNPVIMVQGEFIFTFRLVTKLKEAGVKVVASCSQRKVIERVNESGATIRESEFSFVCFKEY